VAVPAKNWYFVVEARSQKNIHQGGAVGLAEAEKIDSFITYCRPLT
jgi:hypothetical protein